MWHYIWIDELKWKNLPMLLQSREQSNTITVERLSEITLIQLVDGIFMGLMNSRRSKVRYQLCRTILHRDQMEEIIEMKTSQSLKDTFFDVALHFNRWLP